MSVSTYNDLLAAIKYLQERTGDANAWQTGLTPNEVSAALTPAASALQLEAILSKIRQKHPDLFDPAGRPRHSGPQGGPSEPQQPQQGDAADAIARAEAALAQQNSASSQLDLQVISAILNAHLKTVEGREALNKLQEEVETAVRTRSDLDTPAGARDFQRFLISKLRDIRAVVLDASLDDTSKSALMAAWTSLYDASKTEPSVPDEHPPATTEPATAPARIPAQRPSGWPDAGTDSDLDSVLAEDPTVLGDDSTAQIPATGSSEGSATPATPAASMIPTVPSLGGGSMPSTSAGWGNRDGGPLSKLLAGRADDGESADGEEPDRDSKDHAGPDEDFDEDLDEDKDEDKEARADKPESAPAGPTTVTLPDGDTVTAASPQLAAAIKAATGGVPIADAFRQQGITIPAPGTAVAGPLEPERVTPADIGMFTDRYALALGHSKALLDGQIQPISSVSGPSFLGWEHPPTPPTQASGTAPGTEPGQVPTPTRPAATSS